VVDVGRERDRMLDEMEFIYGQRRDARSMIRALEGEGLVAPKAATELLTLLADRVKGDVNV
jgi:hypothetical protein